MFDDEFERRVADALHVPLVANDGARDAIMTRVRQEGRKRLPMRRATFPFHIRASRHSIIGFAFAAGIGSITTLSALAPSAASGSVSAVSYVVIGDTVVSTLRDTLRLVRLIFDAPAARRVAVVGDFNGWRADSTPMHRSAQTGRWSTTLALRDGAHPYALVVDGQRFVADVSSVSPRRSDGRAYSILLVDRTTN